MRLAANPQTVLLELLIAHKGPKLEHRCDWNYNAGATPKNMAFTLYQPCRKYPDRQNVDVRMHSQASLWHFDMYFKLNNPLKGPVHSFCTTCISVPTHKVEEL